MNILISGGAGFIGSNATHFFAQQNHSIVVVDNLLSGFTKNIADLIDSKKVTFYNYDIRDKNNLAKVFNIHQIDVCINFAALISVTESTENPSLTEEINVQGMLNLLELAGKNTVKTFVHASSAAVYGDSEELPKRENMALAPKSPYAITKLAGEYYNSFYASMYGFNAINCRFFNVFGQRQNPESQYAAAVPIFIKRALSNQTITIYGDGEQVRDFIFVEDLISAINYLIHNTENLDSDTRNTFNLGYGSHISINDLASLIISLAESKSLIAYDEPRPGDIKYSYASVEKLIQLGWNPQTGFREGLSKTINWYKKNI